MSFRICWDFVLAAYTVARVFAVALGCFFVAGHRTFANGRHTAPPPSLCSSLRFSTEALPVSLRTPLCLFFATARCFCCRICWLFRVAASSLTDNCLGLILRYSVLVFGYHKTRNFAKCSTSTLPFLLFAGLTLWSDRLSLEKSNSISLSALNSYFGLALCPRLSFSWISWTFQSDRPLEYNYIHSIFSIVLPFNSNSNCFTFLFDLLLSWDYFNLNLLSNHY